MNSISILKVFTIIFLVILSIQYFSYAQEELIDLNVALYNNSSENVYLKVYPVSIVFNGYNKYDLKARYENLPNQQIKYKFIGGTNETLKGISAEIEPNSSFGFNYDWEGTRSAEQGSVGIGIYKFVVSTNFYEWVDTFHIEWDYAHGQGPPTCFGHDLYLKYYNNPIRKVTFQWGQGACNPAELEISHQWFNRRIECWRQPYLDGEILQLRTRNKDIGLNMFIYDGSNSMPFPQDSRRDCIIIEPEHDERHCFISSLSGVLSNFLSIRTDVTTPNTFIHDPTHNCSDWDDYMAKDIVVLPEAVLEIYDGKTLTLGEYSSLTNAVKLYIKGTTLSYDYPNGLVLKNNAHLTVNTKSTLWLENRSNVHLNTGSSIVVEHGGIYCNKGARISGQGQIVIKGPPSVQCYDDNIEMQFVNGASLILMDSAVCEVGNNNTVVFDSSSLLIMKPHSEFRLGPNSRLILRNGARLIASNATFTSLSPGQIWNGIYLENVAQDTILWCTIENASNGITIRNRYTAGAAPFSAEISGCTFSNNTTSQLNYGLSASNSTNILFRNNDFTSSQLVNGFSRPDKFFLERHPKLDPTSTMTDGIFIAGCAQGPKDIPDSVAQASAAAARILSLISVGEVAIDPVKAEVMPEYCSGCRICNSLCPYNAISFIEDKKVSEINDMLCKGCGTCVAACPASAIIGKGFTDKQIMAEIEGILAV